MTLLLPIITAVGGAIIAAMVQIYLGRRSKTGTIGTSEAAEVWAARNELTKELREELIRLRAAYREQADEAFRLQEQSTKLRIELAAVREEAAITKNSMAMVSQEAGTMKIRMVDLERQLEDCRRWLSESIKEPGR